jgi:hypothetical protein
VQVAIPPESVPEDELERKEFCKRLVTLAEIWARQCIADRHAEITDV